MGVMVPGKLSQEAETSRDDIDLLKDMADHRHLMDAEKLKDCCILVTTADSSSAPRTVTAHSFILASRSAYFKVG